eukprot:Protomagalhaensia_sp_Gyna_25__137@NODE_1065_length_2230_cov_12_245094_g848_i0_p5_GENE_NODE_1065_length_2230_cov_12_245094_g848_i0NODE_1065_length_2230_cov_12_245094_g848_i0_p5_ORF_typecomplete_len103_score14_36_NODE_1065_length_2230_cov_12_245094_g848_i011201428
MNSLGGDLDSAFVKNPRLSPLRLNTIHRKQFPTTTDEDSPPPSKITPPPSPFPKEVIQSRWNTVSSDQAGSLDLGYPEESRLRTLSNTRRLKELGSGKCVPN